MKDGTTPKVLRDFGKLNELVLIEEYKRFVSDNIETCLYEHKADTLGRAAQLVDQYSSTHEPFQKRNAHVHTPAIFPRSRMTLQRHKTMFMLQTLKTSLSQVSPTTISVEHHPFQTHKCVLSCKMKWQILVNCWQLDRKDKTKIFPVAL